MHKLVFFTLKVKMSRLPLYRLTVEEGEVEGMDFVGFVDHPAHIKKYVTMSAAPKTVKRYHFNDEQRIVKGVVISTYQPIYRRNDDGFEYNVYFTKEDAAKILHTFALKRYHNNVNLMHDMSQRVDDVALIEMLTINDKRSNIPEEFADQNLQKGSVIFAYKVFNDKAWRFVKENGAGFSLEGWFKDIEVKLKSEKMKKVFAIISQVNEWELEVIEDTIEIGTQLNYKPMNDGDNPQHLQAGEYSYKGSSIIVNAKGVVVMIDGKIEGISLSKTVKQIQKNKMEKKSIWEKLGLSKPEAKKPVFDKTKKDKYAEATTVEGVVVMWDGALEAGTPLFVVPEGEEPVLAPAGEHSFEYEGVMYVVTVDEEGKISSTEVVEMDADDEEMAEAMAAKFKEVEKANNVKFEAFKAELKKANDARFTQLASTIEELTEAIEKLAEGKTIQNRQTGKDKPGWAGMKKKN